MAVVIGALRAELSARIAEFVSDIGKAADSVAKFQKRMNGYAKGMQTAGRAMRNAITLPLLGIGALGIKVAGDFEASMNRVGAATGATSGDMQKMHDMAVKLGNDTVFSATQVAGAMEALAKNGVAVKDILGGATDAAVKLAAATGADLSQAADVSSSVMQSFGKTAEQMKTVMDNVVGTLLQSKFGFDDYRLAIGQAGGVAGALGVKLEDFNAALASTSTLFASGSDAGTSFKTFLTRLIPQSKDAAATMQELGLQFFDASGKMKSMSAIAEELRSKMGALSQQDLNEKMTTLFGVDGMRTAIGLMQQGAKGIDEIKAKIASASADEQSAARMKGFSGEMQKLQGAFESLAIAIADSGVLAALTQFVSKIAELTTSLSQTNPELLKWGVGMAAITAAIGPILIPLGSLVGLLGRMPALIGAVTAAAPLLGAALTIATGPLGIFVASMAALVAAFETNKVAIKAWADGVTATIDAWANSFGAKIDAGGAQVKTALASLSSYFASSLETVKGWAKNTESAIDNWANSLGHSIDSGIGKLKEGTGAFKQMYDDVVGHSYVPDMMDGIADQFSRLGGVMVDPTKDAAESVSSTFGELGSTVGGLLKKLVSDGKITMQDLASAASQLAQTLFISPFLSSLGKQGAGGSFFSSLLSAFSGGFAMGGTLERGSWGIAGERGPEPIFAGNHDLTVMPHGSGMGGGDTYQNFNITTPDADSFRLSERQIRSMARRRFG